MITQSSQSYLQSNTGRSNRYTIRSPDAQPTNTSVSSTQNLPSSDLSSNSSNLILQSASNGSFSNRIRVINSSNRSGNNLLLTNQLVQNASQEKPKNIQPEPSKQTTTQPIARDNGREIPKINDKSFTNETSTKAQQRSWYKESQPSYPVKVEQKIQIKPPVQNKRVHTQPEVQSYSVNNGYSGYNNYRTYGQASNVSDKNMTSNIAQPTSNSHSLSKNINVYSRQNNYSNPNPALVSNLSASSSSSLNNSQNNIQKNSNSSYNNNYSSYSNTNNNTNNSNNNTSNNNNSMNNNNNNNNNSYYSNNNNNNNISNNISNNSNYSNNNNYNSNYNSSYNNNYNNYNSNTNQYNSTSISAKQVNDLLMNNNSSTSLNKISSYTENKNTSTNIPTINKIQSQQQKKAKQPQSENYLNNNSSKFASNKKTLEDLFQTPTKLQSTPSTVHLQSEKKELTEMVLELRQENQNTRHQKERLVYELEAQKKKYFSLEERFEKLAQQYEQSIKRENVQREKLMILQRQLFSAKTKKNNNFQDVLRDQLEETDKIKSLIDQKNQQIARLNETIMTNRRSTEQAINDANIQKLKYGSQLNHLKQVNQINLLHKENQIKTLRHALETMETKLQVAIKQIKLKDQFLQQHIVGRSRTDEQREYVIEMINKMQISFPTNNLANKLLQEQNQIQRLRQIIEGKNNVY